MSRPRDFRVRALAKALLINVPIRSELQSARARREARDWRRTSEAERTQGSVS